MFGWREFGGPSQWQVEGIFGCGATVLKRDLAIAFRVELAQVAFIQISPCVIAIQERDAVIPDV